MALQLPEAFAVETEQARVAAAAAGVGGYGMPPEDVPVQEIPEQASRLAASVALDYVRRRAPHVYDALAAAIGAGDEQPDSKALARTLGTQPSAFIAVLESLVQQHLQLEGSSLSSHRESSRSFDMQAGGESVDVNGHQVSSDSVSDEGFAVRRLTDLALDGAQVLGRGAGGRVLKALHLPTNSFFAVKEIIVGSDEAQKQVTAELSVMWGSKHSPTSSAVCPFIVSLHGVLFSQGIIYVVMDLMDGSLKDLLDRGGPLPEHDVKCIALQLILGIDFMHSQQKRLHRDIKPHNVLFHVASGGVKVADFGIASEQVQSVYGHERSTFCGTLVYMSPDRAEGKPYSFEADIWSVGVTLYQLLLGRVPIDGNSLFAVLQLRSCPPTLPETLVASSQLRSFINLCFDSSHRVSAKELLAHEWFAGLTLEASRDHLAARWCSGAYSSAPRAATAGPTVAPPKPQLLASLDALF